MDLVHQVAANLEIEAGKAEKGIGAILMALRMNLDGETFKKVKHVLPNSESLMGRALMGGARTGEMAALIGPAGLLAALAAAGYQKDDRSEEHTSELQSRLHLVCRLLLEKKKIE